ncbi:processive 1,2-diacylglycerol beta-glucosyltransferase [Ruminiclostridium sufflavum DSM 19573]|uniref:Processive 1,2-diacylglycerol beta-glucosyltransferase n=1 Tax=Ruminiclostridium sufflavum DSM 19573 TaxID=1121337 RepID=A0A318XN50_9FIRM|nr:glycosyltransferase [Ruminiclostridium sufflavum]PYG89026.1 processive 1,2-diacylglycerol beta-glucosyltransferase [Ruminiclostridium sufflavum DSM 19573]
MKLLVLYVSVGTGHMKAAEALKESIENQFTGWSVDVLDTLKYINPIVDKIVVNSYLGTLKRSPGLYSKLYTASGTGTGIYDISKAFNKLLSYRLKSLIKAYEPSAIVCTHPFPMQMLSSLKEKKQLDIPAIAILTDYVVHSLWLDSGIDAFIVANDMMKTEMINRGIPSNIIFPYGIPVSPKFQTQANKKFLLGELGLDEKFTVLVMGGGMGFGNIENTIGSLLKCDLDIQIIAVTGTNKKLKHHLEHTAKDSNKKVLILSYTDRIHELMDISDLLITKPGGMTVSEALVKGLPIFIISPIPGQEEGNASFLIRSGVASRVDSSDQLIEVLARVANDPVTLNAMRQNSKCLGKPNSADDIAALLEKLIT